MRFVCSEPYVQFWGYMFQHGRPVDVHDRGTIERCLHDSRFRRLDDEEEVKGQAPDAKAVQMLDPRACPKCGRIVMRGRYLHIKHCKGAK